MKFGIAKLPKSFYKNTEKKFKCKKTTTNNYAQLRIEKYIQIFVRMEEKVLSLGKFSAVVTGGQKGLTLYLGLLKIHFWEHHVRSRKPTMLQKGTITFNPTYLIKVTHISNILKFLNTESLVIQVSSTRFIIQSFKHLWT